MTRDQSGLPGKETAAADGDEEETAKNSDSSREDNHQTARDKSHLNGIASQMVNNWTRSLAPTVPQPMRVLGVDDRLATRTKHRCASRSFSTRTPC